LRRILTPEFVCWSEFHEEDKDNIQEKLIDLEARSMRDNLIFYGIAETQDENCETLVGTFITETLELAEMKNTRLDRAHRLGPPNDKKTRPIVAKFHYYQDREKIRMKSYEEVTKKNLKDF
jgi:hypothetical protein